MAFQLSRHTTIKMVELLVSKLDAIEVLPNICYMETSNYMPELLGKLYIDLYFDQNIRENIRSMAQMLRDSFRQLLKESEWMDASTIDEAVKKLDSMAMNIGYPDWYNNDTFIMEKYLFMVSNVCLFYSRKKNKLIFQSDRGTIFFDFIEFVMKKPTPMLYE